MFLLGLARWNIPVEIDIMIELGCQKKGVNGMEVGFLWGKQRWLSGCYIFSLFFEFFIVAFYSV